MDNRQFLKSEGFTGVYKEIADIVGAEATYAIYKNLRGQQITFPKRLYSTDYVLDQIKKNFNSSNIKKLAVEFDYTEKYIRQLLKQDGEKESIKRHLRER